jgi:hypothetical protein
MYVLNTGMLISVGVSQRKKSEMKNTETPCSFIHGMYRRSENQIYCCFLSRKSCEENPGCEDVVREEIWKIIS